MTYKQLGYSVIGMTNMPEAKLAREAEICYATVAMVTDFDCWHPDHDAVTVQDIIKVLTANAEKAKQLVARLARDFPREHEPCPIGSDRALDTAMITAPEARDPELLKKLDAVAGRVLGTRWIRARTMQARNAAPRPPVHGLARSTRSSHDRAYRPDSPSRRGAGGLRRNTSSNSSSNTSSNSSAHGSSYIHTHRWSVDSDDGRGAQCSRQHAHRALLTRLWRYRSRGRRDDDDGMRARRHQPTAAAPRSRSRPAPSSSARRRSSAWPWRRRSRRLLSAVARANARAFGLPASSSTAIRQARRASMRMTASTLYLFSSAS